MLHRSIRAALGRRFEQELWVMTWSEGFPGTTRVEERAERAMRLPLGAVSPLWPIFGAAAGAGLAYWWLTRWPRNLEAMTGLARAPLKRSKRIEIIAEAPATRPSLRRAPEEATSGAGAAEAEPVVRQLFPETQAPETRAPEVQPAPAAQSVAAADTVVEEVEDDLTRLVGIGPRLAAALAERGVTRFSQIAAWKAKDLAEVDAALNLRGRAVRDAWVDQARKFAAGA
jgi:predicted flap endonuclease-1-like 5' DNA nuclease